MERYDLKKSANLPHHWVVADTDSGMMCTFEHQRFNDTQRFGWFDEPKTMNPTELARTAREMAEWLRSNHPEIVLRSRAEERATLGKIIEESRNAKGWSQTELATYAGVSKNNAINIEKGANNYNIDNLLAIAEALGLNVRLDFEK